MSMRDFIRKNRAAIDAHIHQVTGHNTRLNDEERRLWIVNSEYLYKWAESEGVPV